MAKGTKLYESIAGIPPEYHHIAASCVILTGLTAVGLVIKSKLKNVEDHILPEPKTNLLNLSATFVGGLRNQVNDIIGHGAEKFIPVIGTTFLFILLNNYLGNVPGFYGATQNLNANLGVALVIFAFYNWSGFKEHGLPYLKQFMGGLPPKGTKGGMAIFLALIGMFMIVIEGFGHVIRPASLSLRLWGNLKGDHTLVAVFLDMTPILVPMVFIVFGLLIATVQAAVFTLLSAVYIKLAVSHDH